MNASFRDDGAAGRSTGFHLLAALVQQRGIGYAAAICQHYREYGHVHIFIGGEEMTGSPFTLLAGESIRRASLASMPEPVQIVSDRNIVVTA